MTVLVQTDKQIQKVKQHSRWVKLARIYVPVMTFIFLLLLFWIPKTTNYKKIEAIEITHENQTVIDSKQAVLSQPHYKGSSGDWTYDITAYAANHADFDSERIDFVSPVGVVHTQENTQMDGRADAGSWFAKDEILELTGQASILHSDGYYVESDRVQVDVRKQEVRTPNNAKGEAEFGQFEADKVRIEDNGNTIWLLGSSHVTLIAEKKPKSLEHKNSREQRVNND